MYGLRNNRPLFVVKKKTGTNGGYVKTAINDSFDPGSMRIGTLADGEFYFQFTTVGEVSTSSTPDSSRVIRSATINPKEITHVSYTDVDKLNIKGHSHTLTIDTAYTAPVDATYVLTVTLHNIAPINVGTTETYTLYYSAKQGDTANSIAAGIKASYDDIVKHNKNYNTGWFPAGDYFDVTVNDNVLTVTEKFLKGAFSLGKTQPEFLVNPITLGINGVYNPTTTKYNYHWGTVANNASVVTFTDSYIYRLRDMEWFLIGDRAETHRWVGGRTTPVSDPELLIEPNEKYYKIVDIHIDTPGDGSVLSNKDICLVFQDQVDYDAFKTDFDKLM